MIEYVLSSQERQLIFLPSQLDNPHLPPVRLDSSPQLRLSNHLRRIQRHPSPRCAGASPGARRAISLTPGLSHRPNTPPPRTIIHPASPIPENHRIRAEARHLRQLR